MGPLISPDDMHETDDLDDGLAQALRRHLGLQAQADVSLTLIVSHEDDLRISSDLRRDEAIDMLAAMLDQLRAEAESQTPEARGRSARVKH